MRQTAPAGPVQRTAAAAHPSAVMRSTDPVKRPSCHRGSSGPLWLPGTT